MLVIAFVILLMHVSRQCAFLMGEHGVSIPCDSGRDDVADWLKKFKPVRREVERLTYNGTEFTVVDVKPHFPT